MVFLGSKTSKMERAPRPAAGLQSLARDLFSQNEKENHQQNQHRPNQTGVQVLSAECGMMFRIARSRDGALDDAPPLLW